MLWTVGLKDYQRKRKFNQTPEPKGKVRKQGRGDLRFVVHMHDATRLHYDLRLEFGGVYRSWAVPKGPSLNPQDQRLAVFVEDHPIEYGEFEGIIPKGNYGAGTVMLWDAGTYVERGSANRAQSEKAMLEGLKNGHLTFVMNGTKLKGEFALIKLKKSEDKAWLLVKKRDEYSTYKRHQFDMTSVQTGRSMPEIAAQAEGAGDVWHSKRAAKAAIKKPARVRPVAKAPAAKPQTTKSDGASLSKRDPMPRKIKPMQAKSSRHGVSGKDWIFESPPEGIRAVAEVEGARVHLYSKSGLPFEKKYPQIVSALKQLDLQAVFDGEITGNHYRIFDLLYWSGKDLRDQPLHERKRQLSQIKKPPKNISVAKPVKPKAGQPIMAKNLQSDYRSGISDNWLLVSDAAAPAATRTVAHKSPAQAKPTKKTPTPRVGKTVIPSSYNKEEPRLTNLNKIFFPEDQISKGDLIEYYRSISHLILPYLKDRPESLNRQPNGIAAPGFYQKDMTGYIPRWLKTERIFSESSKKSIDYVVCQDQRSLLYIVNLGCIEIHPWFSRIGHLDKPDFLVIDLDPDGNRFAHVIEVAQSIHHLLEEIGVPNYCKTSGATGIHIGVPTQARYDFETVRAFAEQVCRVIAKKFPATTSMDRNPNRRRGRIYLDYMQNRRGQTLAAPFCVRPHPGAPVSMPLKWSELVDPLKPEDYHLKNAARFMQNRQDPWLPVLGPGIDLDQCLRKLQKKTKT